MIPILIAVIAGYVAALCCGIVDFTEVSKASIFAMPNFQMPKFSMEAILIILPVLLVITSEHWTSGGNKQDCRAGSSERSGDFTGLCWGQPFNYDIRMHRLRADHDFTARISGGNGCHKGI